MDYLVDGKISSVVAEDNDNESNIPDTQLNPMTIMTSSPPYEPVDDCQTNVLELIDINIPNRQSSANDLSSSLNADVSLPNILTSSTNITDRQTSNNVHMDSHSIAAWVTSTATESASGTRERSPSLPSTLFEPIATRSRGNSTVSTLCDPQLQSNIFDTMSSQQASFSNEMQRSLSVPFSEDYRHTNEDNELIRPINDDEDEDDEDMSTKFLPVPDSEDSEVDKKSKPLESKGEDEDMSMKFYPVPESEDSEVDKKPKPILVKEEEWVKFEKRSPSIRESPKRSPNVSFHASVSFETPHKPSVPHRRRRTSWNTNKPKSPSFQRSHSNVTPPQPPSLHSQILRKQFKTALSMPTGASNVSDDATRQSSNLSDNVFLSPSNTNSSSLRSYLHAAPDTHFLPIPSSSSVISSGRMTSYISDASGQSGIESSNLLSSISDQPPSSRIIEEEPIFRRELHQRTRRTSSTTSTTASTQSLTSSSDYEINTSTNKMKGLNIDKDSRKVPIDKRRDVDKQLKWLLQKKPTTYARSGLGHRKQLHEKSSNNTRQQQKSTTNPFVEFCSSFRSNIALNTNPDVISKDPARLYCSVNDTSNQLHSLPIHSNRHDSILTSQLSNIDPMNHTYTSIRSTHSDSSAVTSLINTKSSSRNLPNTTTSLSTSLHLPRKRPCHRRNLSGLAAVTRDRKNSFTKSDQQSILQSSERDEEQQSPLIRNIEAILNEHITMINKLLLNYPLNDSLQYSSQNPSVRDFIYTSLNELSLENPMNQRCSRIEIKAFIDLITTFHMNRAHHYSFLTYNIQELLIANNDSVRMSNRYNEYDDDDVTKDGHMGSNESSNTSSPSLTRFTSVESKDEVNDDDISFKDHSLHFFRTLSTDYILDCERTASELTKLFDSADQQHILYCLKHVHSGHTNDSLAIFHRRLDALFVWYNLYYELTISVKKLSGLLRCDDCEDWPKLRVRSIATERERTAKRPDQNDDAHYYALSDDWLSEVDTEAKATEESEVEDVSEQSENGNDSDILPKSRWPEEPLDHFSRLKISDDTIQSETNQKIKKISRIGCYRNFVYYMDKRSYQVKYDGLARTLIERVAPVLAKTRLALLQTADRHQIKVEQVLAGLSLSDFQLLNTNKSESKLNPNNDDVEDKLVDTDNPINEDSPIDLNIGELTIEKWLHHVLKSCSTIKTISSSPADILKENWLELHEQLGLPSLLPLYLFIINVLLDVMNECLRLYHKPYMNNSSIEIDSLCRQQLVREAKLVLRDALATRLYSVRMMEQFISHRKINHELTEYDENTVKLYTHYKQFLSTVCINRTYEINHDENMICSNGNNADLYYYVDEETSELIKEYYFARDLTVTLGNGDEIRDLCIEFSTLVQQILIQLKEELNDKTEKYYQAFTVGMIDTWNCTDGVYSTEVSCESTKPSSAGVSSDSSHCDLSCTDTAASLSEQKKDKIIRSTREFRRIFDIIKQRTIRVCSLAKTLIDDFSIAAEFKCSNYNDLWHQLRKHSYAQVKIHLNKSDADDFDNFFVFVPPWLSTNKDQVEKLLSIICSQQLPPDETNKEIQPSFMVFLPKKNFYRQTVQWTGEVLFIQPSESTKLALNSTELCSLHLVVNRFDHWQHAVNLFHFHAGLNNLLLIKKLARDERIRLTFDQLPEHIDKLSIQLTDLVRTLNAIWAQDSTRIYLTEIIKFDERTIESKLVDLVLYIYNSGFELFRLLYELISSISLNNDDLLKKFVSTMNEFFCEWCKCVTKKFKYTSEQQTKTAKYKVLRPRWLSPGMVFLRFLAKSTHLQLLSDEDYKKLTKEMPAALDALYGNVKSSQDSPTTKVRSSSVTSTSSGRPRHYSSASGHQRVRSGGRYNELISSVMINPAERIARKIKNLENDLEQKFRERKQIGKIYVNTTTTTATGTTLDSAISLKQRNIDFPWRRGTRIGEGGAGVAFRAINCSNGSIVCMKEIELHSIASRSLPSTYPGKLRRIAEEIDMIMKINHPNIVRYFGIEKYKRTIYICMEYCLSTVNEFLNDIRAFQKRANTKRKNSALGFDSSDEDNDTNTVSTALISSHDVNENVRKYINENVRRFVNQLLEALIKLHENYIVHCDVKGDNIFIANENGHYIVKLGDFNLSHRLELEAPSPEASNSRSTQKGTIYFKPPEPEYVYKSDIWALGCTIIEMLTGKLPWTNVTRPSGEDQKMYIQNQLLFKKGPPIPDELKNENEAYEFIELCLKPDLDERPSAKELLNHPYPRVRTS